MESEKDLDTGRIVIERPIFKQSDFDNIYYIDNKASGGNRERQNPPRSFSNCGKCLQKCCTKEKIQSFFLGLFPVIEHWKTYNLKKFLLYDIIAGFSAGVIHLPQGFGFALLAGVPPVFGLYTSFLPGWVYYIFGTSRHLSYGTMAVLSLMVGSFVNQQNYATSNGNRTTDTNSSLNKGLEFLNEISPKPPSLVTPDEIALPPTLELNVDDIRVNAAATLTLAVGFLQVIMFFMRLGVVSTFMSLPFVKSFTAGAAIHIIINQLPFQLGYKVKRASGIFQLPINTYRIGIAIFETNVAALLMSIVCMVFLIVMKEVFNRKMVKKIKFPVPAELIVVIATTIISHFAQLDSRYGIRVTGSIPIGFPKPRLPSIYQLMDEDSSYIGTLAGLFGEALPIAIVGFALAITMAKLMAERHNYEVDSNHELLTTGLVNGFSSFFGCIAATQAPPRTLVLESCGCKSQLAGLVSTLLPFVVVVAAGSLFANLPICVLGSVVSAAMLPLVVLEFIDFIHLWSFSRSDCFVWFVCFSTTILVDVSAGLVIGLLVSGFVILFGNKGAKGRLLKRAGSTEIYVSGLDLGGLDKTDDDEDISKCVVIAPTDIANHRKESAVAIFRFECSLYFVNAESFKNTLLSCIFHAQHKEKDAKEKWTKERGCTGGNGKPAKEKRFLKSFQRNDKRKNQCKDDTKYDYRSSIRHVILDFSRISDVDITGVNALKTAIKKLSDSKVSVSICCCPEKSRKRLETAGIISTGSNVCWERAVPLFPSILDAHAFCISQTL